jgi:hypothetical protein
LRNKRSVLLTSHKAGAMALALLCSMASSQAQNLVPNPSFEEYTDCPLNFGYWFYTDFWFDPIIPDTSQQLSSSDYFNACVPYPDNELCSVPQNVMGFQNPRTGNAYLGIALVGLWDGSIHDVHEYISIVLSSKLEQGKKYCVEFYVSRPDNITCMTDYMGAYFSVDTAITPDVFYTHIPVTPQIETEPNVFYSDTSSWQKIEGEFVASGGEQFLTLGCFRPNVDIHIQNLSPPNSCNGSYLWIDDLAVYLCDSTISVNENPVENIKLYPNPSIGTFTVQHTFTKQAQLSVYNAVGSLVYEQQITAGSQNPEINISNFNNGIYLIRVNTPTQILLNERLLIAK